MNVNMNINLGKRRSCQEKEKLYGKIEVLDIILLILLLWALVIILPFLNVRNIICIGKEYYTPLVLIPRYHLENYMFGSDGRIWIGYRTTLLIVLIAVPLSMFLTTSMAYGLSRPNLPFRKFFVYFIVFTMMFNGGIIPLYLLMKQLNLINTLWSVILGTAINSFYLIIMRNYFMSLPTSLVESAKLDGAREWQIMFWIILPISMPIIATLTLFYSVDRWNEWFLPMIFIRKRTPLTLQIALRSIVLERQGSEHFSASETDMKKLLKE